MQVLDVDFAGGRATIKLVPRLDLAAMAKDHMGGGQGHGWLTMPPEHCCFISVGNKHITHICSGVCHQHSGWHRNEAAELCTCEAQASSH